MPLKTRLTRFACPVHRCSDLTGLFKHGSVFTEVFLPLVQIIVLDQSC